MLFFVALELVLTATGVRPVLYENDPYVGFASSIPLFVERTGEDGRRWMVTAENRWSLFNRQRFLSKKAPGTYRIFCLGGSTTYGRPYDHAASFARWLGEFATAADGSRHWEVINAGGISYASYRVAMLMEELVQYEPDLFIIYSGHNEFLERRTYQCMLDRPPVLRNLHSQLLGTRTFSVVQRLIHGSDSSAIMGVEGRDLLPAEVDAVLDHTVGPDSYTRDDALKRRVLRHYAYGLRRMAALARSAHAGVIFVTPASNIRDFLPFKSEHRNGLEPGKLDLWIAHVHVAGEAFDAGQLQRALEALDEAARIDDRHARLHFLRGRVLYRLQRYAEAKRAFERARDEDVCPLRALTEMRTIVIDAARDADVPVVDFAGMIERRAAHGIPGDDQFLDHVHPTIEGHRLLALALLDQMRSDGIVRPDARWTDAQIAAVTERVYGSLDSRDHANALRNLAKVLRWAGKFEQSAKLALRAVEGLPDDAEAHYLAADAWWRQGRLERAIAESEQALAIDPSDLSTLLQLGGLLLENGQPQAAGNYLERAVRIAPDKADTHFLLANALFLQESFDRAEREYREAIRLNSELADAHKNLGLIAIRHEQPEAAMEHFEQALAIDPTDPASRCELGFLLLQTDQVASAAQEFSAALLLEPDCARAYVGLGDVAQAEGAPDEAVSAYRHALRLDPENADARQAIRSMTSGERRVPGNE